MAHQITSTDGLFSVRQMPWHGLGVVLSDYPTREEAQRIAHPWEPVAQPLYRRSIEIVGDQLIENFDEIEGWVANERSDNGELLGLTRSSYVPVSNSEMYDVAEALESEASGDVRFETGGSLQGGRKVWLMLRLKEPLETPGDPRGATIPYYTLQNAHDGSGSFRGQATMIRVVCANTSHLADLDAKSRGTEFVFHHTKNVRERIDEAKQALRGWRDGLKQWQLDVAHMRNTPVTDGQIEYFIYHFIQMPPQGIRSKRVTANVEEARNELRDVIYGVTNEHIVGTVYGLVQGASEWSEHVRRAHTKETRFKRAVLDRNSIISQAKELAYMLAGT